MSIETAAPKMAPTTNVETAIAAIGIIEGSLTGKPVIYQYVGNEMWLSSLIVKRGDYLKIYKDLYMGLR